MEKIAIVTDSNSGITQVQAERLGVYVLPMPFMIMEETYFEDINLTQKEFYQKLEDGDDIATSQPSVDSIKTLWKKLLLTHDGVVHIPMSSGLSGSLDTAVMLSKSFEHKVQVVDNQRISVTQRQSVLDAKELAESGKTASEICEILEKNKLEASIYIMVDTLKYLKKGGRITPAVAAMGSLLRIKPVLQIQGGKLDTFIMSRTLKKARHSMIQAMKKDIKERFGGFTENKEVRLQIAHTNAEDLAREFEKEIRESFPGYEIYTDHLSLSVSCHIGPGALALACSKKL